MTDLNAIRDTAVHYLISQRMRYIDVLGADAHFRDWILQRSLRWANFIMGEGRRLRRADGTNLRLFPAFVDSGSVNAFAKALGDGFHVLAIDIRLVIVAEELATYTMCATDYLLPIGPPNRRRPEYPPGVGLGLWGITARESRNEGSLEERNRQLLCDNFSRHTVSNVLAEFILRIVWLHEFCHAKLGHCDYLVAKGRRSPLAEAIGSRAQPLVEPDDAEPNDVSWNKMMQSLEILADSGAFFMALEMQRSDTELFEDIGNFSREL